MTNVISLLASINMTVFTGFVVLGNLFRIVKVPGFTDNLILSEVLMFSALPFNIFFIQNFVSSLIKSQWVIYKILLLSFICGTIQNGFDISAFSYVIRLIFLIATAYSIGWSAFKRFNGQLERFVNFFLFVYFSVVLLSIVILLLFPDSTKLWIVMSFFGAGFNGDPHQNRLVSVYLDPNYFGAIIGFPLSLLLPRIFVFPKISDLFILFLVLSSSILSGSRSGLVITVIIILFNVVEFSIRLIKKRTFNKRLLPVFFVFLLFSAVLHPVYSSYFDVVVNRILSVQSDPSALNRLDSFRIGGAYIAQNPFFGVGYNFFAPLVQKERGLSALDSSMQNIVVYFGIPISIILMFLFFWWLRKIVLYNQFACLVDRQIFRSFLFYLVVTIIFTSSFNNVLFYSFWLVPVMTFINFINMYLRDQMVKVNAVRQSKVVLLHHPDEMQI
jgi:O-antigen ligase